MTDKTYCIDSHKCKHKDCSRHYKHHKSGNAKWERLKGTCGCLNAKVKLRGAEHDR